jgi:phosphoribosyl 1,2-cyclic phosphodiesterase
LSVSISLTVLASGSRGNAAAVGTGSRRILVDLGLSPRLLRRRLAAAGAHELESTTDVVLTHLDHDHLNAGWIGELRARPWRIWLHRRHLDAARAIGIPGERLQAIREREPIGDGLSLEPVRTPHDEQGSTAWVIEAADRDATARLGWATDLGRVPDGLHERFRDLDALAIESNYDPLLQERSPRPDFLKRRIMGGAGHLSNEESLAAALRIAGESELQAIVLLHLSQQCNDHGLVRGLWRDRAPHLDARLVVATQDEPSPTLRITARARSRPVAIAATLFG